jgi:hypothetical protein
VTRGAFLVLALSDISLQCNDLSLSGQKQTLASGLAGRVYEFTPLAIPPAESLRSCAAFTDAM